MKGLQVAPAELEDCLRDLDGVCFFVVVVVVFCFLLLLFLFFIFFFGGGVCVHYVIFVSTGLGLNVGSKLMGTVSNKKTKNMFHFYLLCAIS